MELKQNNQPLAYFTFSVGDTCYGVDALVVQEAVLLPEITPLEEAPPYIVGAINLRGNIVPVMDLNIRMGHVPHRYNLSDSLIILAQHDTTLAILVNDIQEIVKLTTGMIDKAPSFGEWGSDRSRIITGIGRTDDKMIMVLDNQQFFRLAPAELLPSDNSQQGDEPEDPLPRPATGRYFCSHASKAEIQEFHMRAERLKIPLDSQNRSGLTPVAVIELAGEHLGVELDTVQGFAQLNQLTAIPCCPPHIIGSMNLRGDNLTIIDVRAILNLPVSHDRPLENIMIMRNNEQSVGVFIDQVIDVIHVRPDELSKVPVAIGTLDRKHLKGLAPFKNKMLVIADIQKILSNPDLIVNEEV